MRSLSAVFFLLALAGGCGGPSSAAPPQQGWPATKVAVVPVIANEHIFMKLHPALFFSHSAGYLVRFLLAGGAFGSS